MIAGFQREPGWLHRRLASRAHARGSDRHRQHLKRRSIIAGFKREHVPAPAAVAGAAVYAIITASRVVLRPKSERMREGATADGGTLKRRLTIAGFKREHARVPIAWQRCGLRHHQHPQAPIDYRRIQT
jgi:hypothetical protein